MSNGNRSEGWDLTPSGDISAQGMGYPVRAAGSQSWGDIAARDMKPRNRTVDCPLFQKAIRIVYLMSEV